MDGYVARKGNRWYAVIYHGLDPVTGREQRTWHAAGTDRDAAERLARRLAKEAVGRDDGNRSLTFGAYLMRHWLPAKKIELAPTTFHTDTSGSCTCTSCRHSARPTSGASRQTTSNRSTRAS